MKQMNLAPIRTWLRQQSLILWILFGVFLLLNIFYVHRVPGLLGDEASEGENVYQLLTAKQLTVHGERSYIGPLIDYVRVPFVGVLGYTALALRVLMVLAAAATFWLAASVFRRLFGFEVGMWALVVALFSPAFLLHGRLGWAITLLPFFAFLLLWILLGNLKHKWLLFGLMAGAGLHNHILFAPTLLGIGAAALLGYLLQPPLSGNWYRWLAEKVRGLFQTWPALIGFGAGFGTQVAVLLLFSSDQGDPGRVAMLLGERLRLLPDSLLLTLSGSSFVAHYTGTEFPMSINRYAAWLVTGLSVVGVIWPLLPLWRRTGNRWWVGVAWLVGLAVHAVALLYMIDRFALRYVVVLVVGLLALAGAGFGSLLMLSGRRWLVQSAALVVALVWGAVSVQYAWLPFLRTGGSLNEFSVGDRNESASALVDTRPLVACIRGRGTVTAENQHLFDILTFASRHYPDIRVLNEQERQRAQLWVHYRTPAVVARVPVHRDECPALTHFMVERRRSEG